MNENTTIENEKWFDIPNYKNYYQISNQGRVRSLDRIVYKNQIAKGKILKPKIYKGYLNVDLCVKRKIKRWGVHRLIGLVFIPNPNNYPFINHKNFNRQDNTIENLEWCTAKQNIQHSWKAGRMFRFTGMKGEKNPAAKLTEEKVKEIRNLYRTGNFTLKNLSAKFGVHFGIISYIVNYKIWKHIC